MKTIVDCDAVFDILTQGPFPSGQAEDVEVESHLRVCHDCRGLAEALRPAVGLLHETLADDVQLPRYDGQLAADLARAGTKLSRDIRWRPLLATGLAACLLAWLLHVGSHGERRSSSTEARPTLLIPDSAGWMTLSNMRLPTSCLPPGHRNAHPRIAVELATRSALSGNDLDFQCCTLCHRPGGTGPASVRAVNSLRGACSACHRTGSGNAVTVLLDQDFPIKLPCGSTRECYPHVRT